MSLLSTDAAVFETAVRERATFLAGGQADAAAIKIAFDELSTSELPASEVARRARRLAQLLPPTPDFQLAMAAAAVSSTPAVRTAVVGALPSQLQQVAYGQETDGTFAQPADSQLPSSEATPQPSPPSEDGTDAESEADEWNTVLLLGNAQETGENAQLLQGRQFATVRVGSVSELEALAGERVCGMIVHRSWWQQFADREALVSFVRDLIVGSNLLRIQLDCRGLDDAEAPLSEMIESFDAEIRDHIKLSHDTVPTELDLRGFSAVAELLSRAEEARVGIEEVDESDRRLIASAVESFADHAHLTRTGGVEHLTVRPILDGQSGAKVMSVRSAAYRAILIVKLGPLDKLQEELERARQAIPANPPIGAEMCLCSLDDKGVLVQRLHTDLDELDTVAPSLKERLAECAAWERGRAGAPEPNLEGLEQGIDRAIEQIKQVNRAATNEPESGCWDTVEPLERFAELEMQWTIESADGDFDPAEKLPRVQEILAGHGATHVIHGDLHPGNLLMLDERTPRMIDFATAGAGHPCFDLVRISSGIAYEFIRPLADEATLRRLFVRTHLEGASKEVLLGEFPDLLSGIGPRLAAHALTACRRASLQALEGVEETSAEDQYLAMTYLIAAQSLTIPGLQVAVVRAALGAIGPAIKADPGQ